MACTPSSTQSHNKHIEIKNRYSREELNRMHSKCIKCNFLLGIQRYLNSAFYIKFVTLKSRYGPIRCSKTLATQKTTTSGSRIRLPYLQMAKPLRLQLSMPFSWRIQMWQIFVFLHITKSVTITSIGICIGSQLHHNSTTIHNFISLHGRIMLIDHATNMNCYEMNFGMALL